MNNGLRELLNSNGDGRKCAFGFLDESAKREIRRCTLKAVAIPGHQIPFASREIPISRGWGTGGLQITMSLVGPDDVLKVIDQGCDGSVNAVNLRRLITLTTGCRTTTRTDEATMIQTRHRVPELELSERQIIVFQVPYPEILRFVEPRENVTRRMHAERAYHRMWVFLYEDVVQWGRITIGSRYPVMVDDRYLMDPSPIPRWDIPKLNQSQALMLFGAGREKRIYAIPPFTKVEPLSFQDIPFEVEHQIHAKCSRCGAKDSFLDELPGGTNGFSQWICSDTDYCDRQLALG